MGKLILIIGPMFAGKSSELIRYYKRYSLAGKKCFIIKHSGDTRYKKNSVTTHDQVSISAFPTSSLSELEEKIKYYDVVCIDEIQFFEDGILCDKWANEGKIIIASGLNGTFQRKPWKIISDLIPLSEDIIHLKAICRETGNDASFTSRILNCEGEIIIGGSETYSASDRKTYFNLKV
jgi:thymidine kinase